MASPLEEGGKICFLGSEEVLVLPSLKTAKGHNAAGMGNPLKCRGVGATTNAGATSEHFRDAPRKEIVGGLQKSPWHYKDATHTLAAGW